MTGRSTGQLKAALCGAAFGVACTALILLLARPSRALLARLARQPGRTPRFDWVDPDRSAPSGTRYRTFFSPTVQRDVSYLIYLPPDYETAPENRYPVIYWLHSLGGTEREGARTFVPRLDAAIRSGKVQPVIIVLPNGLGYSGWSDSSDGRAPVESVVIHDLIPHIDSSWRTIANRRDRAIEGFSMGGFGAAHLGFKYPELFGVVAMDSAALFDASKNDEYLDANSPWKLAVRNAAAIRGRTILRLAVGDKDSLLDLDRKFDLLLQALNIDHEYLPVPGVGHNEDRLYAILGTRLASFYARAFDRGQTPVFPGGH